MAIYRRTLLAGTGTLLAASGLSLRPAYAAGAITVAYAGSMGVLMDQGLNPAFQAKSGTSVHGIGQAAGAIASLIVGKSMNPDVFVSVSAPPITVVEKGGLIDSAVPVASTDIVLAYSPKSKFAKAFAAKPANPFKIFEHAGFRLGRTDPSVDPQGAYLLYTLQLAEAYFKMPGFATKVAGDPMNPSQIFAEPSLLARLEAGQIDATLGYESAVISQKLPYLKLPAALNFSDPTKSADYAKASLTLTVKGVAKTSHPTPLVFYAAVLKNAPNPTEAQAYVDFLTSADGQAIFAKYGYNPGSGPKV